MCRILIADDHPMVRDALRLAAVYTLQIDEIHESGSLGGTVEVLSAQGDLDLVLLDLNMPGMNGVAGLVTLRQQFPATPFVIVSAHDDRRLVMEAIRAGAAGFIPKSTPRDLIAGALRQVLAGEIYLPPSIDEDAEADEDETAEIARRVSTLTPQQLRVLELLGTGKLNKEIAFDLDITETTVKAHVSAILQKLKAYSRTQAVVVAGRLQLDRFRKGL